MVSFGRPCADILHYVMDATNFTSDKSIYQMRDKQFQCKRNFKTADSLIKWVNKSSKIHYKSVNWINLFVPFL